MRSLFAVFILAAGISGTAAHAADRMPMEKVKTGILPSGGFYSIYNVTCHDQRSVDVASMGGQDQWCITYAGELSCFKRSQEASHQACTVGDVAATEQNLELVNALQ